MLHTGQILYHGSYADIREIDLSKCMPWKDFGRGFYLTTDREQARRFIPASLKKAQATGAAYAGQRHGFVSAYQVEEIDGLMTYEFMAADLDWLQFVSLNRRSILADALQPTVNPMLFDADVIIGKIANDQTNRVITTYLTGLYGEVGSQSAGQIAIGLLLPDRLKDQVCFRTQCAVDQLALVEVMRYDV